MLIDPHPYGFPGTALTPWLLSTTMQKYPMRVSRSPLGEDHDFAYRDSRNKSVHTARDMIHRRIMGFLKIFFKGSIMDTSAN